MTRAWCFTPIWLAFWLAWSVVHAADPAGGSPSVQGEMVDADLPATYRLPPVVSVPVASSEVAPIDVSAATAGAPVMASDPSPLFTAPTARVAERIVIGPDAFAPKELTIPPAGSPPDDCQVEEPAARTPEAPAAPTAQVEPGLPAMGPIVTVSGVYAPTTTELTTQLLPAVQRGYGLAQKGAYFAARTEFVQVLRRVAQSRDAAHGTEEHSRALAAGLRALDEAEDFVPEGAQLEAELDVRVTASSHRTHVLPAEPNKIMAFEAVALYHNYAQEQLAKATVGEQAGSMALHGLGKIYAALAQRKDDDVRFTRDAMTMYSAALGACPENHLAANELGVLMCRAGRPAEAAQLFERSIDRSPRATTYHNLAVAQQKLGLHGQASANEQEAQRLAAWDRANGEVSRRAGVQWVSPDEMSRTTQPGQVAAAASVTTAAAPPQSKSAWQRTVDITKSFHGSRIAHPMTSPPTSQWR